MRILSLDPAEKFGWAYKDTETGKQEFGHWNFKLKRDQNFAFKLLNFEREFNNIMFEKKIDFVAFERVSGINSAAIMSHSKFVGIIELYCTRNDIPFNGYSASEIKKFATGSGNSKKKEMIKAAIKKFGYRGAEDNEADAVCLLHYVINNEKF